jgi:hypothetical protein
VFVFKITFVLKSCLCCNFCVAKSQTLYGKTGHYTNICVENNTNLCWRNTKFSNTGSISTQERFWTQEFCVCSRPKSQPYLESSTFTQTNIENIRYIFQIFFGVFHKNSKKIEEYEDYAYSWVGLQDILSHNFSNLAFRIFETFHEAWSLRGKPKTRRE